MHAVILAGGDAMRMKPLSCSVPKTMLRLCNRPIAEYISDALIRLGIPRKNIIFAVDRLSDVIADYYDGNEQDFLPKLSVSPVPQGSAAALSEAVKKWGAALNPSESIIVVNGDTLFDFNLKSALNYHEYNKSYITLMVNKEYSSCDDIFTVSQDGVLSDIILSRPRESFVSDMAATGVYIFSYAAAKEISSFGEDILTGCIPKILK